MTNHIKPGVIKVTAILLAAGTSFRMGKDKLLLDYNGKAILQHVVDLLGQLPVYECILITTESRSEHIKLPHNVRVVTNPNPKDGQSSSIRLGIEAATGTHYLFLVADQPRLTKEDILPLLEAASTNPDKIIFPNTTEPSPCVPTSPTIFPERFPASSTLRRRLSE